ERQGIAAFEPVAAGAAPLNQIWYAVDGNAFLAIADTGRFLPATFRPQEQALFNRLEGLLRPAPSAPSSPLSQAQSQPAYDADLAKLTAASNTVRSTLGLPATRA